MHIQLPDVIKSQPATRRCAVSSGHDEIVVRSSVSDIIASQMCDERCNGSDCESWSDSDGAPFTMVTVAWSICSYPFAAIFKIPTTELRTVARYRTRSISYI